MPHPQRRLFEDANCATPLPLTPHRPYRVHQGNEQMLFDGAVAHSLKRRFGSLRILAAAQGMGPRFRQGGRVGHGGSEHGLHVGRRDAGCLSKRSRASPSPTSMLRRWACGRRQAGGHAQPAGLRVEPGQHPYQGRCSVLSRLGNALVETGPHRKRAARSGGSCRVCLEPASWAAAACCSCTPRTTAPPTRTTATP